MPPASVHTSLGSMIKGSTTVRPLLPKFKVFKPTRLVTSIKPFKWLSSKRRVVRSVKLLMFEGMLPLS